MRALAAIAATLLALLIACAPAGAQARLATLHCQGDLAHSPHPPVLLIPGTGVTAEENWSWGYEHALRQRGEGVCTIDLPQRSTVDMQDSLPITAAAIRAVSRRAGGRRIATIGHSQGAAQAVLALRFWPKLARHVDDVIGLSGAYDRGSAAIAGDCAQRCIPPFWQFVPGSMMLRSLATRAMPPGPSVTAIGTLYDTVVTPQPAANFVPGGRSMQIQDICPDRRFANGLDHIHMAADAVAYALAIDALDHPGPADPARVSRLTCAQDIFPGADPVKLATLAPQLAASFQGEGYGPKTDREPTPRCPFAIGCDVLESLRLARRHVRQGGDAVLRVHVARPGHVRLRFAAAHTRAVRVRPGRATLRIRLPRLRRGVQAATVETQSLPHTAWASRARVRMRVVR
jgi:hypothetical protein